MGRNRTTGGMSPSEPHGGGEPERFDPGTLAGLPPGFDQRPLPVGRHGLTRSQVYRNQRTRLISAMLRVLPRHGYARLTIGHLVEEAGVSRAAFYSQFKSKEECFLATYEAAGEWLCERVEGAAVADDEWPQRVRAGVVETLRLLAANPALARLFALDAIQAGQVARERQQGFLARFADALRAGRVGRPELPAEMEEMLLGGALSMIARYVDSGRAEQLSDATSELLQYLLIPYLGPGETQRIARAA
jgi:AcrR family transcriptional regulator